MELGTITNILLNASVVVVSVALIGTVLVFVFLRYRDFKRYNTVCVIYERVSGGNIVQSKDVGGIFVDKKTNTKRFFLKKNDVGLEPDNIPYIMNDKGQQIVHLLKVGLKNFRYLNIKIPESYGFKITVGEEDVNWALNAYERFKKVFGTTLLEKLLPYIGIALMGLFILAMFVVVLQKISVLKDVADAFKEVAIATANAKSGTVVIPS